jgi:threonine dehydrogenase-like Zn-dependent dehydrogenase
MKLETSRAHTQYRPGNFMRAAVLKAPRCFELVETPIPEPAENEVCVRIEGCGICGSNLPAWEGRPWFNYPWEAGAPGHEAWGRVEAFGSNVRDIHPGERVAMLSYHGFAEFDVADADAVVRIADDSKPFPGEPLGCVMNIWRRCEASEQHSLAIVGCGFIGAALTQLASRSSSQVIAISRRPFALSVAEGCGAAKVIPWKNEQYVLDAVKDITQGKMCSRVIECVGNQDALDLAGQLTAERGRLVIAGYHQDGKRQVNMQMWNWRGIDVINAHERDPLVYRAGIEAAVQATQTGLLDVALLLTHRFCLNDIEAGFHALAERPDGFLKAWIST